MDYAYSWYKSMKLYYQQINPASLSGAIDVIVVEQPDGQLVSTPFHVRFGKYGVFNHREKYVDVSVNGVEVPSLKMKLGENGIAFFVEETTKEHIPEYLATSPLPDELRLPTDKVLEESARTLKRHLEEKEKQQRKESQVSSRQSERSEQRAASEQPGEHSGRSVSPCRERRARSCERDEKTTEGTPTNSEWPVQVDPRKALPFTSSVFSDRLNRSLPDLSTAALGGGFREPAKASEITGTKDDSAATSLSGQKTPSRRVPRLRQSKSQALDVRKADASDSLQSTCVSGPQTEPDVKTEESEWEASKGRAISQPISINVPESGERSGSASPASTPSSRISTPSNSPDLASSDIASGALSDTEVDRHNKNAPQPHGSDVAYWGWGQFPRTRDDQQKEEEKPKKDSSSSTWLNWHWFRSSSGSANASSSSAAAAKEQDGIYLDDLTSVNDASKMERYLGKIGSSTGGPSGVDIDSDAGSSGLPTQPNSPIASSPNTNDKTPTHESVANALDRSSRKKKEKKRERKSTGQRSTSSTSDTIFPMSDDEDVDSKVFPADDAASIDSGVDGSLTGPRHRSGSPVSSAAKAKEEVMSTGKVEEGRPDSPVNKSRTTTPEPTPVEKEKESTRGEKGKRLSQEEKEKEPEKETTRFIRSLRLTTDRLRRLGLKMGANECRFSITTKFQGTSWCACNIYLYHHTEKIVISDIDGTITKSDVLGHVIPAIGGQWAHFGVAELYTKIKSNGYKLVYLSSRAIGQSAMTKNYLKSVQQEARNLPDGPVLLAPDSVLVAFRREVIERKPEEFKIAALSDLKKLFPSPEPFFAGFGNRETDVKSYTAVGVDPSRILIIDPSGKLKRANSPDYATSYKCMAMDSVDCIFPPLLDEPASRVLKREEAGRMTFTLPQTFSDFTHWRSPSSTSLSDDDLSAYEAKRKNKSKK